VRRSTRLTDQPFSAEAEYAAFVGELADEGAVVSFLGRARPSSKAGARLNGLFLEHHPRLTQRSIEAIAEAAAARFDISALRIVHRHGAIAPGEAIVFVAAAAAHRRAAFEAADYAMDRLKTEAVFWKREDAGGASEWIQPTEADRQERARWSE